MTTFKAAAYLAASVLTLMPGPVRAQSVQELQQQINELKAIVAELRANQGAASVPQQIPPPPGQTAQMAAPPAAPAPSMPAVPAPLQAAATLPVSGGKPWYETIRLRGYTQFRYSEILGSGETAPAGQSRLRSPHDSGIGDSKNFTFRRVRLVLQGNLSDNVAFYFQPDFAAAVSNQSNGEAREHFAQLRDAYADINLNKDRTWKLRVGQSKVPFGWENLQSSSDRLTLDRSDGINSGTIGERDIGVVAYYTPQRVQALWARLSADGQKIFGNYGAVGFGIYNGQGINRTERNDSVMQIGMITSPFALDGLGDAFRGQILEIGATGYRNRFQPELRTGGVSTTAFKDERIGGHFILYPQPFGLQAEWNWGRGPEFDVATQRIETKKLNGGYVQGMYRIKNFAFGGELMPYARWQNYRGGWKSATNAPRLETDELELGVEWRPVRALELTLAYAHMNRREADERRLGRAMGDLIRTQVQWNY